MSKSVKDLLKSVSGICGAIIAVDGYRISVKNDRADEILREAKALDKAVYFGLCALLLCCFAALLLCCFAALQLCSPSLPVPMAA